ncbi:MAG: nickel-dependent hydrogenase large subunit [Pseudomonadota bacterium]
MTQSARTYELCLKPESSTVVRRGPGDIAQLGIGRSTSDILRLAGLMFPLCPRAHVAASLNAIEQASAIQLSQNQRAARDCLILSEALVSAIWRAALHWPELLGQCGLPAAVRDAHQASQHIEAALYQAPWAHPGGAEVVVQRQALDAAIAVLSRTLCDMRPLADEVLAASSGIDCSASVSRPLEDALFDASVEPNLAGYEETPRALHAPPRRPVGLAPWFQAQCAHAQWLLEMLLEASQHVANEAPAQDSRLQDGSGLGISMTARGRLRHALSISDGVVTHWSIAAPTDWNFAPRGPIVKAANQLLATSKQPEHDAKWLVAAYDPCAPCSVHIAGGGHA